MKIVTTKSTDGIYYKGLLTESDNPMGLIIHGMSGSPIHDTYYPLMHEIYPKSGWSFLAVEHRGTGSITQFNSDNGVINIGNAFEIFEDCIHDIQGWVNFAKELGYKRIWLQSHSLGTAKTAYFFNQTRSLDISGLIWISPSDMLGLVHDPLGIKDHEKLLPEALNLVKQEKPRQLLSDYLWEDVIISAQSYLSFFGKAAKDAIFNYESDRGWEIVNSITVPVLALTGTEDDGIVPVIDVNKAMELLSRQLSSSPNKKTIIYQTARHSFVGFENNIVNDVMNFIKQFN